MRSVDEQEVVDKFFFFQDIRAQCNMYVIGCVYTICILGGKIILLFHGPQSFNYINIFSDCYYLCNDES